MKVGVCVVDRGLNRAVNEALGSAVEIHPVPLDAAELELWHLPSAVVELGQLARRPSNVGVLLELSSSGRRARLDADLNAPILVIDLMWQIGRDAHSALSDPNLARSGPRPDALFIGKALSNRESQVLKGISGGLTRQQVANRLAISIHTVDTYIGRLKEKLDAPTIPELVSASARLDQRTQEARPAAPR